MVNFKKLTLNNGLRVLVHEDISSPMAVMNILYDVGSKDENPEQTGFAHLFEHLMFGGSINIPSYDEPLQRVGGENNAFTSNDITNYYIQLPAENIETAFWLESDRMLSLAFSEKSLETQRNVVCEEFKQRYLNQPYGDVWLNIRPLAYKTHPYQWATIGKKLEHIEDAKLEDVKAFFKKHYNPQNAIMVIAGNVSFDEVKRLSKKWFEPIHSGDKYIRNLPKEPIQTEARSLTINANVPLNAIYKVWHICNRKNEEFYHADLLTDVLSRGDSSRLYCSLVKEKQLFSDINAYQMGEIENSLLVVEGKLINGISMEEAEMAINEEIEKIKNLLISENELTKVKNKVESTHLFSELNLLDKAMHLAFFELLGDAKEYNNELVKYRSVTDKNIQDFANKYLNQQNCSTLYYLSSELTK